MDKAAKELYLPRPHAPSKARPRRGSKAATDAARNASRGASLSCCVARQPGARVQYTKSHAGARASAKTTWGQRTMVQRYLCIHCAATQAKLQLGVGTCQQVRERDRVSLESCPETTGIIWHDEAGDVTLQEASAHQGRMPEKDSSSSLRRIVRLSIATWLRLFQILATVWNSIFSGFLRFSDKRTDSRPLKPTQGPVTQ